MRGRRFTWLIVVCHCLAAGTVVHAETPMPQWWWSFTPAAAVPLGTESAYYSTGGGLGVSAEYVHPSLGGLVLGLGIDAAFVPLSVSGVGGLIEAAPVAGAAFGVPAPFLPGLGARVFANAGYAYVGVWQHVNGSSVWYGMDPFLEAGGGVTWALNPVLALRLSASYRAFYQLYGSLNVSAGIAFTSARPERAGPSPLDRPRVLDFGPPRLAGVFPIFHAFYDEHALGTVEVRNTGSAPVQDVRVSFLIRQYMDGPKECARIASLAPGEAREVPLFALFNASILSVTEPTKVTAELGASYRSADGSPGNDSATVTVAVYDRNAMTWDDDRKAAAFVSPKDPWVLLLSNNVIAMVKDLRSPGVNPNLQTAIAFHAALRVYGLAYSPNPSTPYAFTSAHPEIVDFLKFPRQTLSYRAGDCSDLSILYAAFFESVGIDTAFITVPGHIFVAASLDLTPEQARARMPDADDLVYQDGRVWLPIETTMRDKGLLDAWREAAREWHQGLADRDAAFYPVHDAWKTYPPVGLAADATAPTMPAEDLVKLAFAAEVERRRDQEVAALVAPFDESIRTEPTARAYNGRGVAFARYGRTDRAESDFRAALDIKADYAYALVNLGNLATLRSDVPAAYEWYRRAVEAAPADPHALLALAHAASALGKNDEAGQAFASARSIDPELAARYGEPGLEGGTGTRAAQQGAASAEWEEE